MENENNCQTGSGRDGLRHGAGMEQREGRHEAPPSIDHSISPGVPCPETVLVAVMSDGSYLLVSYPQGKPAAFVIGEDAGPLRQALAGAFGNRTDEAASGDGNATAMLGNKASRTEQAQP